MLPGVHFQWCMDLKDLDTGLVQSVDTGLWTISVNDCWKDTSSVGWINLEPTILFTCEWEYLWQDEMHASPKYATTIWYFYFTYFTYIVFIFGTKPLS